MQIDPKVDLRWHEALLGVLEGDLSYSRVAEAKVMLRAGIDSIRKARYIEMPEGLRTANMLSEEKTRSVYVIEAKELMIDGRSPVYLRSRGNPLVWTPDIDKTFQFSRIIDAERYMVNGDDGTWKIVEHGFCTSSPIMI